MERDHFSDIVHSPAMRRFLALFVATLSLTLAPSAYAADAAVLVGALAAQDGDCPQKDNGRVVIEIVEDGGFATIHAVFDWYETPCIGDFGLPLDRTAGTAVFMGDGDTESGWRTESIHPGLGVFSREWLNITPAGDGSFDVVGETTAGFSYHGNVVRVA